VEMNPPAVEMNPPAVESRSPFDWAEDQTLARKAIKKL